MQLVKKPEEEKKDKRGGRRGRKREKIQTERRRSFSVTTQPPTRRRRHLLTAVYIQPVPHSDPGKKKSFSSFLLLSYVTVWRVKSPTSTTSVLLPVVFAVFPAEAEVPRESALDSSWRVRRIFFSSTSRSCSADSALLRVPPVPSFASFPLSTEPPRDVCGLATPGGGAPEEEEEPEEDAVRQEAEREKEGGGGAEEGWRAEGGKEHRP